MRDSRPMLIFGAAANGLGSRGRGSSLLLSDTEQFDRPDIEFVIVRLGIDLSGDLRSRLMTFSISILYYGSAFAN